MERLILGYDGSRAADAALDWVVARARERSLRVEAVHVRNSLSVTDKAAERHLDRARERLLTQVPALPVETYVFGGGMPAALVRAAERADLLVVGIDPDRPLRTAMRGWRSLRVSARSSAPTCVVPAGWHRRDGAITVGVDDDSSSDRAVEFAAAEASRTGRVLDIVHAWVLPSVGGGGTASTTGTSHQVQTLRRTAVTEAAERARSRHPELEIQTHLVRDHPVAAVKARSAYSALIVIGTHHRGVLGGGFFGSVAQDLLGAVTTPICIVPEAAPDEVAERSTP